MTIGVSEALPPRAALLSEELLSPLGRRWRHVQGVARRAGELALLAPPELRPTIVAAAWLHDVGYAPELVVTGLHPLDGARHLRPAEWPDLVVSLVAYHTGAQFEAEERGLASELAEFAPPPDELLDLVTTADLTTTPDGEDVEPEDRLSEIFSRYAPGDPVHRAVSRSAHSLLAATERVNRRRWAADARSAYEGLPDRPL